MSLIPSEGNNKKNPDVNILRHFKSVFCAKISNNLLPVTEAENIRGILKMRTIFKRRLATMVLLRKVHELYFKG